MKLSNLVTILIVLLSGCKSAPYAIIDGSRSKPTDQYSHDVIISGIDGQKYFGNVKSERVKPGPHYIELTSTKQEGRGEVTYKPWYFKAEPCKRYIVAAKHSEDKKFSNKYWSVELLRVEPILSCELPKDNKAMKEDAAK